MSIGQCLCRLSTLRYTAAASKHLLAATYLPVQFLMLTATRVPAVNQTADKAYYLFDGYAHFASGLACGLAGLGAGMAIGIVGDAGVR